MRGCHVAPRRDDVPVVTPVVALAGNPNSGKTSVFNLLTGTRQHVGNWPGVTIEQRRGTARLEGTHATVVDLPGVYSLLGGGGPDQAVARDFLLGGGADLVVHVVDASNLERHLALTWELLDTGRPLLVVLNMVDEARANGLDPRADLLSGTLGIPVVPMVARRGTGRRELLAAIEDALAEPPRSEAPRYAPVVERALAALQEAVGGGGPAQRRALAIRLLEGYEAPSSPDAAATLRHWTSVARNETGEDAADLTAATRFAWANRLASRSLGHGACGGRRKRVTDAVDAVALNAWLGVPVFLVVLYLVFVLSFSGGNILLDLFDGASAALFVNGLGSLLLHAGLPGWLVSVIAGGSGGGLNLVVTFIPPIAITFLLLAVLEDSGYMARAAYAMDRLMRRLGLPGNALVPMVIGFGCNVPAVMGARVIEDRRDRLLTVLMQPFMSCSARLTIYMAFAVVFFRGHGGQVVFLLYVLGIVVALLTALLLGRTALPGEPAPFVMELPPYRLPSLRSVGMQSWQRLRVFVLRVGRVIALVGLVLFVLPGIGLVGGRLQSTDVDHSLLAQGSRALVPVFAPMGLERDNWPAVSGLIAGAAAKEVVIGTLNGVYQRRSEADRLAAFRHPEVMRRLLDAARTVPANAAALATTFSDPLGLSALGSAGAAARSAGADSATLSALGSTFTPLSAFAYLVFVLLYVPCASTIAALRREVGWAWTAFSAFYGLAVAWAAATLFYQAGTAPLHPLSSLLWIALVGAAGALFAAALRRYGLRRPRRTAPAAGAYS